MAGHQRVMRDARSGGNRGAYVLIVRGADGRPRVERFNDVAAYRARLVSLEHSGNGTLSIEEIARLLDT